MSPELIVSLTGLVVCVLGVGFFAGTASVNMGVATLAERANSTQEKLTSVAESSTGIMAGKVDAAANRVASAALAIALALLILAGVQIYIHVSTPAAEQLGATVMTAAELTVEEPTSLAPVVTATPLGWFGWLASFWGGWLPPVDANAPLVPTHAMDRIPLAECNLVSQHFSLILERSEALALVEARELAYERARMAIEGCHSTKVNPYDFDDRPPRGRFDSAMGSV